MTFFFLVVGLEAKRELDLGELRERRRITVPVAAAVGGATVPVFDLPRVQPWRPRRRRVGRGDVDGYRLRARGARVAGARGDAPARLPAHARRGRRPHRAAGDRHRVHRSCVGRPAHRRRRAFRRDLRAALRPRSLAPAAGRRVRRGALGRAAQVGYRPRDRRPRRGADHERLPARSIRARARRRAHALVPRAAHAGAGALRPARRRICDLAQRAAPIPPAALDQLRDRAAVRARQRGRRHRPRPARRSRRVADHARHPLRLHRRQARRHPRRDLDHVAATPGRASPHAQLAGPDDRRHRVGHRLHRLAADLHDRARPAGSSTKRRSACWPPPSSRPSALR